MVRTILRSGLATTCIAACTVNNNHDPFGGGNGYPAATYSTTVPSSGDGESSETTDDGEPDENDDDAVTSTGMETSGGADPAADAATESGGPPADATTDDGGAVPDGNQPADGLWSQCTTAQECGPIPALCIYLVDEDMNPTDGFCSKTGCVNPAADCPSPGGTAAPVCVPVDVEGPQQACALSCAAGMCPVGMACVGITDLGMICI